MEFYFIEFIKNKKILFYYYITNLISYEKVELRIFQEKGYINQKVRNIKLNKIYINEPTI